MDVIQDVSVQKTPDKPTKNIDVVISHEEVIGPVLYYMGRYIATQAPELYEEYKDVLATPKTPYNEGFNIHAKDKNSMILELSGHDPVEIDAAKLREFVSSQKKD